MDTERWFDTQSMRSSMTAPHEELRALRRSLDARQIARATEVLGHSLRETGGLESERGARLLALTRPEVIWSLARYHGVSGLVYQRLQSLAGAPESLLAPLRSDFQASVHRHLRSTWELSQLKPMLDGTGVPWAVVNAARVRCTRLLSLSPEPRKLNTLAARNRSRQPDDRCV